MKMVMFPLAACLALALPVTVSAATAPDQETETKAKKPKKLCKRVQTTGSRMKTRVCMTEAEWDKLESGELGAELGTESK